MRRLAARPRAGSNMTASPRVRILDKSQEFATVHGERSPTDPHASVYFYQEGLPLDAQGFLVANAPDLQGDSPQATRLRELAERKLKKASKAGAGDTAEGSGALAAEDDHEEKPADEPVNLEAWARGEQHTKWLEVSQHIARYK